MKVKAKEALGYILDLDDIMRGLIYAVITEEGYVIDESKAIELNKVNIEKPYIIDEDGTVGINIETLIYKFHRMKYKHLK